MQNLNRSELEYLRKIIIIAETLYNKYTNYAEYSVDPQIKQIFNKAAEEQLINKQKLVNFLND
ncbi:MAG: hypothetical protein IKM97_02860 [Clostridia bacterium]|nr:hypothetical protein [Clostridia bacterium]